MTREKTYDKREEKALCQERRLYDKREDFMTGEKTYMCMTREKRRLMTRE